MRKTSHHSDLLKTENAPLRQARRDEVLLLRNRDGLSFRIIGERLGISAVRALQLHTNETRRRLRRDAFAKMVAEFKDVKIPKHPLL